MAWPTTAATSFLSLSLLDEARDVRVGKEGLGHVSAHGRLGREDAGRDLLVPPHVLLRVQEEARVLVQHQLR